MASTEDVARMIDARLEANTAAIDARVRAAEQALVGLRQTLTEHQGVIAQLQPAEEVVEPPGHLQGCHQ